MKFITKFMMKLGYQIKGSACKITMGCGSYHFEGGDKEAEGLMTKCRPEC